MADTQDFEDEVLRRMLVTPPKPHKPLGRKSQANYASLPRGGKKAAQAKITA